MNNGYEQRFCLQIDYISGLLKSEVMLVTEVVEMRTVHRVEEQTDCELQREIMRSLSSLHDKGGRSVGRSLESALLSAAHTMHDYANKENAVDD